MMSGRASTLLNNNNNNNTKKRKQQRILPSIGSVKDTKTRGQKRVAYQSELTLFWGGGSCVM